MPAKFNLLCDSTCDFSQELMDKWGLRYAPFTYVEADKPDGGFHGVDDLFQSRSPHDFYENIRWGAAPLTSQPSQAEYDKLFREALETGLPSVMVCISTGISGGYNGACTALDRLKEERGEDVPLYVVDSLLASTSLFLLMQEAVKQRDKGLSAEEFVRWIEDARYHVQTIFMVDNLDTLHHGGRIPKSVALVSGALDAKPLLSWKLDGGLTIIGVTRGRKKAMKKMVDYYEKNHSNAQYPAIACIGNADCDHDGMRLGAMLADLDDSIEIMTSNIGPTIGCHVGPGMLSCVFWGEDRRSKKSFSGKVRGIRQA